MITKDLLQTAFIGIGTDKKRTFLTMLGIIIGVASVVLMVSIGRSFQNYILSQIESFGTNTLDISPKAFEQLGASIDSLTYEDYEELQKLSTVERVVPAILVSQQVSYQREETNPMIMGANEYIFGNYGLKVDQGRLFDQNDIRGAKSVAVVSSQTALDLFGNANPIGKKITIGSSSFTVIGTLESQGSLLLQDLDKPIYIPFTTARAITGQKYLSFINLLTIGDPAVAVQDITLLLRQLHNIDNPEGDPDKDDFIARSAEQITSIVSSVTLGLTVFLSLVAAISLIVGGIGIMNIMLVSVTERTREIGLRKAVGARRRDILLQFLLEAMALTMTGGVIGITIGVSVAWFLAQLANRILGEFEFVLSLSSIGLAVLMAVSVGLLFGMYPAQRAAKLHPIEALRYE